MKRRPRITSTERSNKVLLLGLGLAVVLAAFLVVGVKLITPLGSQLRELFQPLVWSRIYRTSDYRFLVSDARWSQGTAPFVLQIELENVHMTNWDSLKGMTQANFKSLCGAILTNLPPYVGAEGGPKEVGRGDIDRLVLLLPPEMASLWGQRIDTPINSGTCGTPIFWASSVAVNLVTTDKVEGQDTLPPQPSSDARSTVPVATYHTAEVEWNFKSIIWHNTDKGYGLELVVLDTLIPGTARWQRVHYKDIASLCEVILLQLPGGLRRQATPSDISRIIIRFSGGNNTFGNYNRGQWRRVLTSQVLEGKCTGIVAFHQQKTIE